MAFTVEQSFYDFTANDLIIGGLEVTGFGEDGSIEYDFQGDIYEHASGADGHVAISRQNDYRMVVTVTVMENSQGNRYLAELVAQQTRVAQLAPPPMPYLHRDRISGDEIKSPNAVFLTWPSPNKARSAGTREYTILLPHGAINLAFGGVTVSNL